MTRRSRKHVTVTAPAPEPSPASGRARLFVTYIDVWSVAKMATWMWIFAGVVIFAAFTGVWWVFDSLHVAASVEDSLNTVIGSESFTVSLSPYVRFTALAGPVALAVALACLVGAFTTTVCAAMYNVGVKVFGGVEMVISDAPTRT